MRLSRSRCPRVRRIPLSGRVNQSCRSRTGADARGDGAADGIRDGVGGLLEEHVPCSGKVLVSGAGDGTGQVARVGRWGEEVDSAAEDGRLSADGGERGGLVVGPQARQEPDGGVEGSRGDQDISEQRLKCGARVAADLEGQRGAHRLGKQPNGALRRDGGEPAQHVRRGTGQEAGNAALSESAGSRRREDQSVRLHGPISWRPAKVGEGDHPAHRVSSEGEWAGHAKGCQDIGEVFGELLYRVGAVRGRTRPAMTAVVIADDPNPVAPLPG